MSDAPRPVPPATPDPELEAALAALLAEPDAWAPASITPPQGAPALRARLRSRVRASAAASRPMHHARLRDMPAAAGEAGAGLSVQGLYQAEAGRAPRAGEPLRVRLLRLAPGARATLATAPQAGLLELLVLRGGLEVRGLGAGAEGHLQALDFVAAAAPSHPLSLGAGPEGALCYLREAPGAAGVASARIVRDAEAGWQAFAPGIRRRVLWQEGPLAAMLYLTEPGAAVPHHGHGHDEECLSVQGEVFADDVLLTEGDFQLAPAGTEHRRVSTDTGGIVYLHGDIDLALK